MLNGGRMASDGANRVSAMTRPSSDHRGLPPVVPISVSPHPQGEMITDTIKALVLVMSLLQGCTVLSEVERPTATPPQPYERRCGPITPMEPLAGDPRVVTEDRVAV